MNETDTLPLLDVDQLSVRYGNTLVVDRLSFSLAAGEIGCLLGASGCGKTTVLRAIAGFEPLSAGEIRVAGTVFARAGYQMAAHRRGIGMVFQDYALFPHLTVAGNVGFGLEPLADGVRRERVAGLLELVGLAGREAVYPHELSGGQQQRVALARALAPRPRLLLLDEPFSNLDVMLRETLGQEVRQILKRENVAAVLVTHDQREAFAIADQVGVMRGGRIEQWATPYALYHAPATRFVADFVGEGALLTGVMAADGRIDAGDGIDCHGGMALPAGAAVDVLLRPDDVVIDPAAPLRAEVVSRVFRGAEFLYALRLSSGRELLSLMPSHARHEPGEQVGFRLDVQGVALFPRAGG